MASHGRKRKHPGHAAAPLAGEHLARAILALPPQPQPICCRVEGCLEPLAPGYHKKYRICLRHSKADELCIEGSMRRWCQQCGRFHALDMFDSRLRSCRHSLARHQERRKRRQAQLSAGAHTSQPAHTDSTDEMQAAASEKEQQSQLGGAEGEAPPQPEPAPLLSAVRPPKQAAARRPCKPAIPANQQWPCGLANKARVVTTAPAIAEQPPVEQHSLPAAQHPSELHCAKRPRLSLPPETPAAPGVRQERQAQQSDPSPPVTPPGQPACQAASSLLMAEAASPMCSRSYAVTAQQVLLPRLQQAAASPSAAAWGQPLSTAITEAAWGQPLSTATTEAAWGQQPPSSPSAAAWAQQPPASPSAAAWGQPLSTATTEAAWGQQPPASPSAAAWAQQPPASPSAAAWGQQPSEGSWLLIIGDQRLAPVQPPLMHPPALLPQMQQQVFWPAQLAQQAQQACSTSGGWSAAATCFPRYEPALAQEPQMRSPVAVDTLPHSPFVEVAACSASAAAAPPPPRMGAAPPSLPPSGSATASTYTTAAPVTAAYGGSLSHLQCAPFYGGGVEVAPVSPSFWAGAGLPAPLQPPPAQLQLTSLPPEGCTGSSSALNQAWGQPGWQEEEQQLTPRALTTPRAAAPPPSPRAEPPFGLQPSQLPSRHAVPPIGLQPSQLPSQCATLQSSMAFHQLPGPGADLPFNMLPARLPSLPLPQAPLACPQAQQCWEADWADGALIPSPLSCPPSPAISWLAGFS